MNGKSSVQRVSSGSKTKYDIISGQIKSIVPKGCIGEQYTNDVALIFKIKKVLVSTRTKYQKVDVIETDHYGKILFLDGLLMKTDRDGYIINEMIVHVIMNTGQKKKKVLVVGGGEGFTVTELLKYPYIEQIDVIDIDGEFVEIAKKIYSEKMKAFNDPRVSLFVEEGLQFMRRSKERYDAIFTTPTDPLTISDPLFVDEYYKLCADCLVDDGIYETDAYMPFYQYGNIDYAYIQKHMAKVFKISKIYYCVVPTFPGGFFCFGAASKKYDPETNIRPFDFPIKTRYYNFELHRASFKLPQFMVERLKS